jgi:pyruvate dehydrogenase E2 component (dihydrolipoamide acetyltransferase)
MSIKMTMPRLSDTMQQGTVVKWNVKPGQKVKSGDVIADIETDKATMELPTYDEGTVAQLAVKEGEPVPVGTLILVLAEAGEDAAALAGSSKPEASTPRAPQAAGAPAPSPSAVEVKTPAAAPQAVPAAGAFAPAAAVNGHHASAPAGPPAIDRVFASPLARKIAAEHNMDLAAIEGTGPSGRIVRKDVEAAVAGGSAPAPGAAATGARTPGAQPLLSPAGTALAARRVPLSNMRRTIAARLVESKTTIPHYQVTVSARMDALLILRSQLNEQLASFGGAQGVKLSVNDFLVRACALAMHQHPYVNARWAGPKGQEYVEYMASVNVGIAIALPIAPDGTGGGLLVATLRDADAKGLRKISAETRALSDKARHKGLTLDEMADSTFTISNLGMFGVDHFTAIINPPNVAILAVGAAIEQPVIDTAPDGAGGAKTVGIGTLMSMTMSSDHRVVDGAMAAQYLATVKSLLERPATLLV